MAEFNWAGTMGASPVFLILTGCSIVTLGVAIERLLYYWMRRGTPDGALARVLDLVRRGQLREAAWTCQATVHPFGPVALTLFAGGNPKDRTTEERIQIALSEQKLFLERNLGVLGTMAAVAPLIGLLGTVVGIMRAFHDMAQVGNAAPAVVAAGVAEALVTTAAGLVVAVPAVMLYNHFARRANTMLTVAENQTRSLRAALIDTGVEIPVPPHAVPETSTSTPAPAPSTPGAQLAGIKSSQPGHSPAKTR
jgi:biopolymer transport protein ExbB